MHTAFEWEDMQAKGPFGRCTCKWEDNMKMDLQEMRQGGLDQINMAQDMDRWQVLMNAVMNWVP